tara:strand:+ start:336 stop:491 length:156 start_codon:yes stop_codon:yes gene_type:complete
MRYRMNPASAIKMELELAVVGILASTKRFLWLALDSRNFLRGGGYVMNVAS